MTRSKETEGTSPNDARLEVSRLIVPIEPIQQILCPPETRPYMGYGPLYMGHPL